MHCHQCLGTGSNHTLYDILIYLKSLPLRLHQYGFQSVFSNGKDRCDIGIGRNQDFITRFHNPHLHIGMQYEPQGIKSVCARHTVTRAYVIGILPFKSAHLITQQIPAAVNGIKHRAVYLIGISFRDFLKRQELYHNSKQHFISVIDHGTGAKTLLL